MGPVEIIAHRIVWCVAFLVIVLTIGRQWPAVAAALASRRVFATLFLSASLVSVNWGMYVFSVVTDQLIASSLGYFLSPLVNVLLGYVVLGERPTAPQWLALALATAAVATQVVAYGSLPWIALTIALFVECLLLSPFSLAFLLWLDWQGAGAFGTRGLDFDLLIVAAGLITGIPLLLFAAGARRIRLTTIGLIQYVTPSTYLVLAVWLFGEPFGISEIVTFGLLWAGLFLYTSEVWRTREV